jgi:L-lactate dehydrogenase (cytochrome)
LHYLSTLPNIRGLFVTVDSPVIGKREADERVPFDASVSVMPPMMAGLNSTGARLHVPNPSLDRKTAGYAKSMGNFVDASLSWDDLAWIRQHTDLPIVLKGVQHAADAVLAAEHKVQGIVLSNHGGRSLDTAPPALLVLLEMHKCCPDVFEKLEVYVDGGIRRGTDVLKALCLGARAVGLGRPFLYGAGWGVEGVERVVESECIRIHSNGGVG